MDLKWTELIDKDMPAFGPITKEVVDGIKKTRGRFRGSVRISQGKIFTDEEYEAWRKRVLKTALP